MRSAMNWSTTRAVESTDVSRPIWTSMWKKTFGEGCADRSSTVFVLRGCSVSGRQSRIVHTGGPRRQVARALLQRRAPPRTLPKKTLWQCSSRSVRTPRLLNRESREPQHSREHHLKKQVCCWRIIAPLADHSAVIGRTRFVEKPIRTVICRHSIGCSFASARTIVSMSRS